MSTILFMIHTIVQIVSRLLCNNALFFQRCPSHPMALCDLRQRAKAPQGHVQLWLEEGQVVRILIWIGNDWMIFWLDVSPPVPVFPRHVRLELEMHEHNATNHISPQAYQDIQRFHVGARGRLLQHPIFHLGCDALQQVSDSNAICYHLSM